MRFLIFKKPLLWYGYLTTPVREQNKIKQNGVYFLIHVRNMYWWRVWHGHDMDGHWTLDEFSLINQLNTHFIMLYSQSQTIHYYSTFVSYMNYSYIAAHGRYALLTRFHSIPSHPHSISLSHWLTKTKDDSASEVTVLRKKPGTI